MNQHQIMLLILSIILIIYLLFSSSNPFALNYRHCDSFAFLNDFYHFGSMYHRFPDIDFTWEKCCVALKYRLIKYPCLFILRISHKCYLVLKLDTYVCEYSMIWTMQNFEENEYMEKELIKTTIKIFFKNSSIFSPWFTYM